MVSARRYVIQVSLYIFLDILTQFYLKVLVIYLISMHFMSYLVTYS